MKWDEQLVGTYLFEGVGIEQDPAKLNNLGGILCNIDTVLIASGSNVNDDVALHAELRALLRRHFLVSGGASGLVSKRWRLGEARERGRRGGENQAQSGKKSSTSADV